jgi:hypothetical protein
MTLTLENPLIIGSRLAPALKIGDATLSLDKKGFVLDMADGSEHRIDGFRMGAPIHGDTVDSRVRGAFEAMCGFLSACAESRSYGWRTYQDPMKGENSDLFSEVIGVWAEKYSDELGILAFELSAEAQEA